MSWAFEPYKLNTFTEDEDGRRIYNVTYVAHTTTPLSSSVVSCRAAFNISYPYGATTFSFRGEFDTSAVRTRPVTIKPQRQAGQGSNSVYYIDTTFDSAGDKHCSQEDFSGPPWTHPWKRKIQVPRVMEPVFTDKDGDELVNYADEPYNPAVELAMPHPSIVLTGNLQSVNFFTIVDFLDRGGAVNQSAIGPFPERTLKLVQFEPEELFWGTCQRYYSINAVLEADADTFDLELVQLAYRTKTAIGDYTDLGTALPQPIDATGALITSGSPVKRTHKVHNEKDFSTLIPHISNLLST